MPGILSFNETNQNCVKPQVKMGFFYISKRSVLPIRKHLKYKKSTFATRPHAIMDGFAC